MGEVIEGRFSVIETEKTISKKPSKQYSPHPFGFGPKVQPQNIPQSMKDNCRWCLWKAHERKRADGGVKMDKIPYNLNGRVSTAHPGRWMSYSDAIGVYLGAVKANGDYKYNGIGILVLDIVCVDIDDDLDLGVWENVDTYKEYSPSGNGLRIIGDGWTDDDLTKPVEIYSGNAARFVTITGDTINGLELIDIGDMADAIVKANRSSGVSVSGGGKTFASAAGLPELILFDNQDWWPKSKFEFKNTDNRSDVIFGWAIALIDQGLTNQQIYSVFVGNETIMDVAPGHNKGNPRMWLWQYNIITARDKVNDAYKADIDAFGNIPDEFEIDEFETVDNIVKNLIYERDNQDDNFKRVMLDMLQTYHKDVSAPFFKPTILKKLYRNVIHIAKGSKYLVLDKHGFSVEYTEKKFLECEVNGKIRIILGKLEGTDEDTVKKFITKAKLELCNGIVKNRQITCMHNSVDMFIKKPLYIRNINGFCRKISQHELFNEDGPIDKDVMLEYKNHFPDLDAYLYHVVCSRFADNRRKAMTWLHASSNWGKGFLSNIFKELDIVLTTNEKELEKTYEGGPTGLDLPNAYKHWLLFIDEFSRVKSELKLIDDYLTGSPKNQMKITIPMYAKLFTSAETIPSLTGDMGVDGQFRNRFNYIGGKNYKGNIDELPLFIKKGQTYYFNVVRTYVAKFFNKEVKNFREMGRFESTLKANKGAYDFHEDHGIKNTFHSMEDNFEGLTIEFKTLVNETFEVYANDTHVVKFLAGKTTEYKALFGMISENSFHVKRAKIEDNFILVTNPDKIIRKFLNYKGGDSEGRKVSFKSGDIIDLLGGVEHQRFRVVKHGITGRVTEQKKGILIPLRLTDFDVLFD